MIFFEKYYKIRMTCKDFLGNPLNGGLQIWNIQKCLSQG